MTDKKSVKNAFSRAAGTYDKHSQLQGEVAARLAQRIMAYIGAYTGGGEHALAGTAGGVSTGPPVSIKTLLDVGCRTGGVLEALALAPETRIHGCDISFAMLDKARGNSARRPYRLGLRGVSFADSSFDIVASSPAYQWSGDMAGHPRGRKDLETRRALRLFHARPGHPARAL